MIAASIAAAGITSAVSRFEQSAIRTAQAPLNNQAEETVERVEAKTALSANIAVLKATDEMTGRLLDILA